VSRLLTGLLLCGFGVFPALAGGTAPAPDLPGLLVVTEWPVPWGGRPRDPYVDASGAVWFCGQEGNYIGRLDPVTGKFKRYEVPDGTHPHNLIVDAGGFVWYAGNRNAHIGKLDPASGAIEAFPMPEPVTDPHTLVFDRQGNIWFTAQQSNAVGRLDTASGQIRIVMVPSPGARPYGIKIDSRNRPWIVLLGTNRLATVDPVSFALREIPLPEADMRPRRLEIDRSDIIWFVDYAGGRLGRYDPAAQSFAYWQMPGGTDSRPYGTALDAGGILWIGETGPYPNRLIGFDTARDVFISADEVPGGGAVRHMYYDAGADAFWFGLDSGFIDRGRRR